MNDGDPRWRQDQQGDWHHPERGSWRLASDGQWYPLPSSGGGCLRPAALIVLGGVLLGGCAFIVADPVVALAVFFVGIPFALFMGWLILAVATPRR